MCRAPANEIPIPCDGNNPAEYETRLCGNLGRGNDFVFEYCNSAPGTTTTATTTTRGRGRRGRG